MFLNKKLYSREIIIKDEVIKIHNAELSLPKKVIEVRGYSCNLI